MKHFDSEAESPHADATVEDRLADMLDDEQGLAAVGAVIEAFDHGVIFWSAEGRCLAVNRAAPILTEATDNPVRTGAYRNALLEYAASRGTMTVADVEKTKAGFASGAPFTFVRSTPSGKTILTIVRPRADGGHVVVLQDISEHHRTEETLMADKIAAEEKARELAERLERQNAERAQIEARQEELQRLSLVAAHAKDLIVITDATNRIVWANEAYRRHNGYDLEMDLIGKSQRDVLVGPESDPDMLAVVDDTIRHRQSTTLELICHKSNGETYWMEQEIIPVFDADGAHTNYIIVGRDISERKSAEEAAAMAREFETSKRDESRLLSEFNEWLQSTDSLDEVLVVVRAFLSRLFPGSQGGVYTYVGSREMLVRACAWGERDSVDDMEPAECWALRRGRAYYYGDNTVDIPCGHVAKACGDELPARQYCLPIIAHGDTVGLLSLSVDDDEGADAQKLANFCAEHISLAIANVKLREQLREQSTRDPLTGLYNRRYFIDFARREIARCKAQERPAALIAIDVDHFKQFNDRYGHDAGDMVLKSLAEVMQRMFRDSDKPCRIGGEEFVVMLPGAGVERAMERAEQLRETVEAMELSYGGEALKVTLSAGVASYPKDGEALEVLMQTADAALYKAKGQGRNQVVLAE